MLNSQTKKRIDDCRNILVGKITDPKSQVEQITIALIYKFMDDMDRESEDWGGVRSFFVGEYEQYSWSKIFSPRVDAHELLNLYAEGIEKMGENPSIQPLFRRIFKDAYLPYRDPETLKLFLKIIDGFSYDHSERLGDAFEYLLSILGSQGDAGQFRTPRHIIDFIIDLVEPQKGDRILDPACGTSGFLISSYKQILENNTKEQLGDKLSSTEKKELLNNIHGYDISPDMVRLSLVNLFLHGFTEESLNIHEYDTLTSEDRWNEYFDVILANPPFMTPTGGIRPHNRFSVKSNRAEVLFVNYIMEHLTPKGRSGIVVPEGVIFKNEKKSYNLVRKSLVEKYLVGVISLPAGVFNPYSGVKTSILLLDRELSKKTDKIFFGKVENDGFSLGKQRIKIDKNDLPKIKEGVKEYYTNLRNEKVEEHPDLNYVSREEILNSSDVGLSYERYVEELTRNSGFETAKLKSLLKFDNGYAFKSEEYLHEGVRIIRIKNVQKGVVVDDDPKYYPIESLKEYKNFELEEDDILISLTGNVGRVGKIKKNHLPALLNQRVCRVRIENNTIETDYLFNILNTSWFEDYCIRNSSGSAQKNLSTKVLGEIEIPLPPLEIQKEIVEELEQYQKVIDGAKQVVENYKPHIEIDESWEKVELGEVCEINPKKSELNEIDKQLDVSFCPMAILNENNQRFLPLETRKLGDVFKSYTYFKDNDVLLAKVTPCFENGKAGIADNLKNGIGFGSSEFIVIRPSEHILKELLYVHITSDEFRRKGMKKFRGTSGLKRIPVDFVSKYLIPIPPIEIQNQIVQKLEEERKIVEGNKKLIEIHTQKIEERINKIWGD